MKPEKLLERLASGKLQNVSFSDFCALVEALGFKLDRVRGSHHIYEHPAHSLRLNLQERGGQAKPCQIRQLLALVEEYSLRLK